MSKKTEEKGEKVVLVGETQTGKTCIIMKAVFDQFEENKMTTYVASSYIFEVDIDSDKKMKLDIWDTAGQERFRNVNKIFYKDAKAVLLVYDITKRKSFDEIKNYWAKQAKDCACENAVLGVIGNKADMFENEEVQEEEAKAFAESIGAFFVLTSAKQGTGIHEAFKEAAEKIEERGLNKGSAGIQLSASEKTRKKKCCEK